MTFSTFERGSAIVALAGTLVGCSPPDGIEDSPPPAYTQIDENTYLIDGYDRDLDRSLPESLAQFRQEVAGNFVIILGDARNTLTQDALALRDEAAIEGGSVNRIVDVKSATVGK